MSKQQSLQLIKKTETLQKWQPISSTPIEVSTSAFGHRPLKRPRLEEETEEEEDMDISDIILPHHSTYEPGASTTAASLSDVSEVM